MLGAELREVGGRPINPALRGDAADPILTGVSAIDGLATLVRGQKLPIFSVGGLPHLELAAQIAAQATRAATSRSRSSSPRWASRTPTRRRCASASSSARRPATSSLFLNTADDPLVERIVTPRIALTVAEHLAFDLGRHVLVVMADMTSYCEAVREVAAARGEVPSRRGYPGYLYSDLASLYERAGRIQGTPGSVTQLPVLTMPGGDITHPVPDLTGYITEGQIVLSQDLHVRGVYPPFDPLSLALAPDAARRRRREDARRPPRARGAALRARRAGAARRRPRRGRRRGRAQRGRGALPRLRGRVRAGFVQQGVDEARSLDETLDRGWRGRLRAAAGRADDGLRGDARRPLPGRTRWPSGATG